MTTKQQHKTVKKPTDKKESILSFYVRSSKDYKTLCKKVARYTAQKDYKKSHPQVYWNGDSEKIKLSKKEIQAIYKECKKTMIKSTGTKTMVKDWPLGSYRLQVGKYRVDLFVRDQEGKLKWYYSNSKSKDTSKADTNKGGNARKTANEWVINTTGKSIVGWYGRSPIYFRLCNPRPFYYLNDSYSNQYFSHFNCIDACSQYPSGFLGDMPTTEGHKTMKGTVKPTEDYPFAFYLKSGHLAIYDELDTHDWKDSPFADQLLIKEQYIDPSKDVTVLMKKAGKNPLKEFFLKQYEIKETYDHDSQEYKDAKDVMNCLIGMMHQKEFMYKKTSFQLAHISAVAIARGNQKILNKAMEIGKENIAQIIVDSIIYKGKEDYGTKKKEGLGTFHQEVSDSKYAQLKQSTYAFWDKEWNCLKFKHGASDDDGEGNEIKAPKDIADMNKWCRKK